VRFADLKDFSDAEHLDLLRQLETLKADLGTHATNQTDTILRLAGLDHP
jgi:hypothetical protein